MWYWPRAARLDLGELRAPDGLRLHVVLGRDLEHARLDGGVLERLRRDDRSVVLDQQHALVAERRAHEVGVDGRVRAVVLVERLVFVEQHRHHVVGADRPPGGREHRHVVGVGVNDRVHVGTRLVEAGVEPHCGRRLPVAFEPLEPETDLHDPVRRGLVEVLERRDVERVLTHRPRTHVSGDATLAAVVGEDPARRGELEADVVDVHHTLAVNAAPSGTDLIRDHRARARHYVEVDVVQAGRVAERQLVEGLVVEAVDRLEGRAGSHRANPATPMPGVDSPPTT